MTEAGTRSKWFLNQYCIGTKLRQLRQEKRLTLVGLSAATGLSTALLSKLETERMAPTLATLATLCRVYGVGMGHFFHDPVEHALSITRKVGGQGSLQSSGNGYGNNGEAVSRMALNSGSPDRRMDASLVDLPPGASSAHPKLSHAGSLLVYVLEGQLHLDIGGLRESLDAGDCAYLESDLPAAWSAAGKQRCRLLTVAPAARELRRESDPSAPLPFVRT